MLHKHRPTLYILLYVTLLLWLTNCVGAGRTGRRGQGSMRPQSQPRPRYWKSRKPNIVLILTDDQDLLLGSMSAMNKTRTVLGDNGANFINAFVTTPICCPSRSSILTGQYVHNHHVYSNTEDCGSADWRNGPERRSFAAYLRSVDYRTGYFGKYLNNYNGTYVPPGWTEWVGLLQNSKYYNYTLSRNGQLYEHGFNYYRDYLPDLIANDSVAFFRMSKRTYPDNPVAMVLSFPAPHGPEDGAPQYQGLFEGNRLHRTETWNYTNNNDKHWLLRYPKPMTEREIAFTDLLQRKRLITLVSVDDAIAKLCTELSEMGEIDNTYIIFTSDHGYHLGQYALPKGKSLPYDFDLRVPFYMRGPRVPTGVEVPNIVLNIDLAPTILDIAGVAIPPTMDGVSLLKLFNPHDYRTRRGKKRRYRYIGTEPWRSSFLVEKTRSPEDLARLQKRQFQARGNKEDRLRQQCELPELQTPCEPFQDKECALDEVTGELKIRKCRRPPKIRCRCMRPYPDPEQESYTGGRRFRLRERPIGQSALTRQEKRQQRDFIQDHVQEANPPFRFIRNKRDFAPNEDRAVFTLENLDEPDEDNVLIDPKCEVFKNDTVICANEIFESRKAWVHHRKMIAARVRLLRKHLNDLIEIKEFLKDTNPYDLVKPEEEVPLPQIPSEKQGKPGKVCRCDNIEGDLSEEAARELERLGDVYVENKGDYEDKDQASRYTRSVPVFGENADENVLLEGGIDGLSRRQRKLQFKQMCSVQGMKCTSQDNDHWRVPPYWTLGHMCMCLNAVNNTYQCLRFLNETHNFLYCEYVTKFLEYFDMRPDHDPHQKVNAIYNITDDYRRFMRDELANFRFCSGASNCTALNPATSHHGKPATSGKNSTSGENRHGDTRTESTATPTPATSDQLTNPAATISTPLQTTPTVTLDPSATFDPSVTSLETQPPVPLTREGLSVEPTQLTSARKTSTKTMSTLASVTATPERELGTEYKGSGTELTTTEHLTERKSQTSETTSSVANLSTILAADQLSVITTLETPNEKSTSTASVITTSAEKLKTQFEGSGSEVPTPDNSSTRGTILSSDVPTRSDTFLSTPNEKSTSTASVITTSVEKLESQFEGSGSEVPTTDNSSTRGTILSSEVPTRSGTFLSTPVTTKEPSVTTSLNGMLTSAQTSPTSEEKPEMEFEGSGTDLPTTSELFSRDTVKIPTAQVPTTKESFVIRTQDPSLEEMPTSTLASMTETLARKFELNFDGSGNDNPAIIELLEEKTTESPEVPQASVAYVGTTLIPVVDEDFNEQPQSQEKKSAAFTFSNFHRRSNSEDSTKTRSHRNAVESNKNIKQHDEQHAEQSSTDITGPPQLPTAAVLERPTQFNKMHPTRASTSSLPLDTAPSSFHSEIEGSGETQGSGLSEATSASFISSVTQRSTPSSNSEGSGSPATSRQVGRPNFLETTPTGMELHGKTLEGASGTDYAVTLLAANEEPSKRNKRALSDVEILEEHDGSNLMDNLGQNKQDSNPPKNKDKTVSFVVDDDTGAKFLEILDEQ